MSIKILAIDTTTEACSAALMINDYTNIYDRFLLTPYKHTKYILPIIDSLLYQSNIDIQDINLIAFGMGPGNFTGIRISISIAQGLALGHNIPIVGISTLATLAQGAWRLTKKKKILTIINAGVKKFYWAKYFRQQNGVWLGKKSEMLIQEEKLINLINNLEDAWMIVGTGWDKISKKINKKLNFNNVNSISLPSAKDMLFLALQKWNCGDIQSVKKQIKANYLYNDNQWGKNI